MSWRLALALSALAAVALATWFARGDGDSDAPSADSAQGERGYYLSGAHIFGTGDDGEVLYEIEAVRAVQAANQAPIELTDVSLDYAGAEARWRLQAGSATLAADGEHLAFRDNVVATRSGDDTGEVVIRTDSLSFDPVAETVETDDTVRFELGDGLLLATGLLAHLNEDRIELRSNIRGQFEPR